MKLAFLAVFAIAGVLGTSPSYAETCDEMAAQDLNSKIEAELLLAETSESLDADGQDKIRGLREDFSAASDQQTQALDSGDEAKMNEICASYKEILAQLEALKN